MLLQTKCGRQSIYSIYSRLFRARKKPTGSCGKAIQKAPTGFSKKCIVSQRALAGPAWSHQRYNLTGRQGKINVAQIILRGSGYVNIHGLDSEI